MSQKNKAWVIPSMGGAIVVLLVVLIVLAWKLMTAPAPVVPVPIPAPPTPPPQVIQIQLPQPFVKSVADNRSSKAMELDAAVKAMNDAMMAREAKLRQELKDAADKKDQAAQDALKKQLEQLAAEKDRLEKLLKEYEDRLQTATTGQPSTQPSAPRDLVSGGPSSSVYDDDKADNGGEMFKALLKIGAAALCVYQPEACPFIMAIASALGSGDIKNEVKTLGALSDVISGNPVSADGMDALFKAGGDVLKKTGINNTDNWMNIARKLHDGGGIETIQPDVQKIIDDSSTPPLMKDIAKLALSGKPLTGSDVRNLLARDSNGNPVFHSKTEKDLVRTFITLQGKNAWADSKLEDVKTLGG